ncbi:MAG: hypothetical protein QM473_18830 [Acidobacteriota bacterium]|nr:hypothetical protein [Acidobacteriota bacterium]
MLWLVDMTPSPECGKHYVYLMRWSEPMEHDQLQGRIGWSALALPGTPSLGYLGRLTSSRLVAEIWVAEKNAVYIVLLRIDSNGNILPQQVVVSKACG